MNLSIKSHNNNYVSKRSEIFYNKIACYMITIQNIIINSRAYNFQRKTVVLQHERNTSWPIICYQIIYEYVHIEAKKGVAYKLLSIMQKAIIWQIVEFPQSYDIKDEIDQKGQVYFTSDITNNVLSAIKWLSKSAKWKFTWNIQFGISIAFCLTAYF